MTLDFRNTNTLWASVLVETLARLGLRTAIICPGSRSAPLAIAFAQHPQINALSMLDERSAAFFGLGHAQRTGKPAAIVCTSGTAGANFFPAIIEAHESQVPLLAFTADRPPELRHCHAGQAIDQLKLYGHFPNWQTDLALPAVSQLNYLRQTIQFAWEQTLWPVCGPVHVNCPFRDPLTPTEEKTVQALAENWNESQFFQSAQPLAIAQSTLSIHQIPLQTWQSCDRGLIIAGPAQPANSLAYCGAIAQLSEFLGWPVLAEGLSPLRNYASVNPYLIASYAIALKDEAIAETIAPEQVIQVGPLPTSKAMRQWLNQHQPLEWILDPSHHNVDSIHGRSTHLRISVESLAEHLTLDLRPPVQASDYLTHWLKTEAQIQTELDHIMSTTDELWESKITWGLGQSLPRETLLFVSNSMPVRDMEWFWGKSDSHIRPYFNRGANGIDGTLSTAMGMAFGQNPSVLLTGDLAFLHDINGLLPNQRWAGHLTIIILNNNGGGIFEMLPISNYNPPFEEYFATPQQVRVEQLCAAYGIEYEAIVNWESFNAKLNPLPNSGIRVLEIRCDRKSDHQKRQDTFQKLTAKLTHST